MDAAIARLNIDFYRKRLGEESDEAKRAMIQRLLAEELAKLVNLENPQKKSWSCELPIRPKPARSRIKPFIPTGR